MTDPDYHLQLIVMYENGYTAYATFSPEEWISALERFIREMADREVCEASLILHRKRSPNNGDHIVVQEYYR